MPDIKFYTGNDFEQLLLFDRGSLDQPIDISAWTIRFTMKTSKDDVPDDSSAIIKKDIGPLEHFNPMAGSSLLSLGSDITNVAPGIYYFDIKYFNGSSFTRTITEGKVSVLKAVTNR